MEIYAHSYIEYCMHNVFFLFSVSCSLPFLQGLLSQVCDLLSLDLLEHHDLDLFQVYQLIIKGLYILKVL